MIPNLNLQSFLPFLIKLLIVVLVIFASSKLLGPLPFEVKNYTSGSSDVFSMSGEGRVSIKPDVAIVILGIEAEDKTVEGAQSQINEVSKKVTEGLKKLGIKEEDIKTESYNIYPEYDYSKQISDKKEARPAISSNPGPIENAVTIPSPPVPTNNSPRITGYRASTNLRVKVKDTEKVNEVIDVGAENGANQIGGVSFDIEDRSEAEDEARVKAVEDAKKKAQMASKTAGIRLGKIVNYYESLNGPGPYYGGYGGGAVDIVREDKSTQIEPGSMEVIVTATLTYQVK